MADRYFLVGGAGFIGAHIAKKLVKQGKEVFIFDSFTQYTNPLETNYKKALDYRLNGLRDSAVIDRGDTRNKRHLESKIDEYKPEIIIQLAHLPLAKESAIFTEEAVGTIIDGTVNLLDIAKDRDFIEKFIYTSSSMVYGDFEKIPAPEDHPKRPKDVYGGMKLAGEEIVKAYSRRFGLNYVVIRPSAVYGPSDINRRVSEIFIRNALQGKLLRLDNMGKTKLDFSYVEDVADGFILASEKDSANNETFNIVRGEGRSLEEFAKILSELIEGVRIEYRKSSEDFRPKRGAMDISKARELIGYNPKVSLEEGIKRTLPYYQNENSSL